MGCAPTGSGKSGAFVIPSLILAALGEESFYGVAAAAAAANSDANKDGKEGEKEETKEE